MKKKITVWYRQKWEHNHIEDGHVELKSPTPMCKEQEKSWKRETWKKKHAHLVDGKVVE